jgi:hypothetical protein
MMYGQLVAIEHGWPIQIGRPEVRLRSRRLHPTVIPGLETGSRIAVGGAVGAAFGAVTFYPVLWIVLGAALAVAVGRLRDGAR